MMVDWWRSPLQQARRAARAGRWTDAATAYRRHLRRDPAAAGIWVQLGHSLKEQGDLGEAVIAYREAVRLAPVVEDGWIHLAHLERRLGDREAAIVALERAIAGGSAAGIAAMVAMGARERLPAAVQRRIEAEEGVYALSRYAAWRETQAIAVPSTMAGPAAGASPDGSAETAPSDVLAVIDGRGAAPAWIALTRATLGDAACLIFTDDPSARDTTTAGHRTAGGANVVLPVTGMTTAHGVAAPAPSGGAGAAGGDAIPAAAYLLLVEAGTRLALGAVTALQAAIAATGAGAAYGDHDHWAEEDGGVVYRDPCFQPMFDPLWFARAAVRPPCLLVTAEAAAPHATWAALFAHRLALPVAYAHLPRLIASCPVDVVAAPVMPLPARATMAGADPSPETKTGPVVASGLVAKVIEDPAMEELSMARVSPASATTGGPVADERTRLQATPQAIPGANLGVIQVIVQTRDAPEMLEACIDTLRATADRPNLLEIVIMNNRSVLPRTAALLTSWAAQGIARVITHDEPFNWARANNLAAALSDAPYLLFLNNDVEMTSAGWDTALRAGLALDGVGAMGALLLYPDGLVQHAGVVFGMGEGGAVHEGVGQPPATGPADRRRHPRLVAAVTGAWLAVPRPLFERVGGYEERLAVAYNDVDFCLRVRAAGQGVVQAAHIVAVHRESATRGSVMSSAEHARDQVDWAWMRTRWGPALDHDPAYNPHWLRIGQPFDGLATPSDDAVAHWIMASARSRPWGVAPVDTGAGGQAG